MRNQARPRNGGNWDDTRCFATAVRRYLRCDVGGVTYLFGPGATFRRHTLVWIIYRFFALCLIRFWLAMRSAAFTESVSQLFFVWVSVFKMFTVSVF